MNHMILRNDAKLSFLDRPGQVRSEIARLAGQAPRCQVLNPQRFNMKAVCEKTGLGQCPTKTKLVYTCL